MTLLFVALGGAVGAPLRYLTDRLLQRRVDQVFPWGTLTVNVVGSLVLGVVLALAGGGMLSPAAVAFLGTGVCGALTTFSTFSFETLRLVEQGAVRQAVLNVAVSLTVGFGAAAAGYYVTAALG
ncbi:MAG: fluoride efflux transporter CrcB [Streptosporangiales bacterium]|nr:fluoride efflux transporter CrcB [Streptosporangiales bacterium]